LTNFSLFCPPVTDTQEIYLKVTDVNDTPPKFTNVPQEMIATVDPNALEGRIVYTLSAEDPEAGAKIEYEQVSGKKYTILEFHLCLGLLT
jgi:hypothetical protein